MNKNAKTEKAIPRWLQGLRHGAFGDVWDAMTPSERKSAFMGDLCLAFGGAAILYLSVYLFG